MRMLFAAMMHLAEGLIIMQFSSFVRVFAYNNESMTDKQ
jgi:hypothetical protein